MEKEIRKVIKTWKELSPRLRTQSEWYYAHEDALLELEGALEKISAEPSKCPGGVYFIEYLDSETVRLIPQYSEGGG